MGSNYAYNIDPYIRIIKQSIEINIGATFHNLSFDVLILKDGVSLTSIGFDSSHPVVL
jgi:hypothetical protein